MQVEGGKITALAITNERGVEVFQMGMKRVEQKVEQKELKPMLVSADEIKIIRAELARTGLPEDTIFTAYHIAKLEEMTLGQFQNCKKRLLATKTKEEK